MELFLDYGLLAERLTPAVLCGAFVITLGLLFYAKARSEEW